MSSFKDRLSFWEQKKNVQEVKPFPKPPLFQPKKLNLVSTPLQSTKQSQVPPKVIVTQKPFIEEPIKPLILIKNEPLNNKLPEPIIKSPVKEQVPQKIKTQQDQPQSQNKVSSVKDKINKFNNLAIPVFGSVAQSCYVGSYKNKESSKIENHDQKKTEPETVLIKSTPLYEVVTQDENKLSFRQRILMAQKTFANRNNYNLLQKKVGQEPKQQGQQGNEAEIITLGEQQSTQHETEHEAKESQETKADNESQRLFMESIKDEPHQPNLLVNGQANELTLQTRMTRRLKAKNNDEDFDDL